jgi:acyl-CoA thioesterase-1
MPNISMSAAIRTLALLVALWLAGCSPSPPALTPLAPDAVVVAFGNSLTHGTGASREASYPAVLEGLIGQRVVNAGVPGEETAAGLARLPAVLDRHAPALLLLCHGGNDLLRKRDPERTKENLRAMVREAKARGVDVVLIAVPRPTVLLLSPHSLYAEVAEEMHVPLLEDTLTDLLADDDLKSDTIHLNAAGYRRLAEGVAALLHEAGAL